MGCDVVTDTLLRRVGRSVAVPATHGQLVRLEVPASVAPEREQLEKGA